MEFHDELKITIHKYIKLIYEISKEFPRDEIYGVTSQFRRAGISIMLNYIEGYARRKGDDSKVYKNFLQISYGSLKETKYLLFFTFDQGYVEEKYYKKGLSLSDKIGKMLWCLIK
ncbi:four helix bundle protein [Candidatus Falkowbacteria bacterium]|nr:four helix bundle protein [Candidatus Falkowbacteria bacterium]